MLPIPPSLCFRWTARAPKYGLSPCSISGATVEGAVQSHDSEPHLTRLNSAGALHRGFSFRDTHSIRGASLKLQGRSTKSFWTRSMSSDSGCPSLGLTSPKRMLAFLDVSEHRWCSLHLLCRFCAGGPTQSQLDSLSARSHYFAKRFPDSRTSGTSKSRTAPARDKFAS